MLELRSAIPLGSMDRGDAGFYKRLTSPRSLGIGGEVFQQQFTSDNLNWRYWKHGFHRCVSRLARWDPMRVVLASIII